MTAGDIYRCLLAAYGPQGWWPILDLAGANPTSTGRLTGYHPALYDYPRDEQQRFEICVGAILTQNTAWINVERALLALRAASLLAPEAILAAEEPPLAAAIRPSGYFNVKARKLRELSRFILALGARVPRREELLAVWGVGPETADSIRLYAYGACEMVVDAYTRRILAGLHLVPPGIGYEPLKAWCRADLPAAPHVYQEFHALMVEHAKRLRAGALGTAALFIP